MMPVYVARPRAGTFGACFSKAAIHGWVEVCCEGVGIVLCWLERFLDDVEQALGRLADGPSSFLIGALLQDVLDHCVELPCRLVKREERRVINGAFVERSGNEWGAEGPACYGFAQHIIVSERLVGSVNGGSTGHVCK
ncbi:MAG TPA: hypothetical protein VJN18_02650 [Polyangiaceae bacterium]|nr:hypothetical protein [Polyangiaceae bacterium]